MCALSRSAGLKRAAGCRVAMNGVMDPKPDRSAQMRDMFKTRSHSWERVGLSQQFSQKAARRAPTRRATVSVSRPKKTGISTSASAYEETARSAMNAATWAFSSR